MELAEERAEKRMEEENPDSVLYQLLSLLDDEDKKAIVQDRIEHIYECIDKHLITLDNPEERSTAL